jgi:tetratricopeptide (TPR) repeat protein
MTLVGRHTERDELAERLASSARLVTVFGPPGVGKSAVAIAALSESGRPHGYVDAASIETPEGLSAAVACAHEGLAREISDLLPISPGISRLALEGGTRGRLRSPWVLVDNAEHLLGPLRAIVTSGLPSAPNLRLVVTSRQLLAAPDEWAFEIRPLCEAASIDLLLHTARQTRRDVSLGADAEAVFRFVGSMYGLPLVVTACAARLGLCGWRALARELAAKPVGLLVPARLHGNRTGTLGDALSFIFDSLSDGERAALRRCSVFEGTFTNEAAESVLDDGADGVPVGALLSSLRGKSLLSAWAREELPAETRLDVHAVVRAAALQRLAPDEDDRCVSRHATYYVGELTRLGETPTDLDLPLWTFLAHESANLFAIVRRWLNSAEASRGAVRRAAELTLRLERVLWTETPVKETHAVFDHLFVHAVDEETLPKRTIAELLLVRAGSALVASYEGAIGDATLALSTARRLRDAALEGRARAQLGTLLVDTGSIGRGILELRRAVRLLQARDVRVCGSVLVALSDAQRDQGGLDDAAATLDRARQRYLQAADDHGIAIARLRRGLLMLRRGDTEEAAHNLHDALTALRSLGDRFAAAWSLGALGRVRLDQGDCREARSFLESARDQVRQLGDLRLSYVLTGHLGYALHQLGDYDAAAECYLAALGKDGALRPLERAALLGALGALRAIHGRLTEAEEHIAECRRALRTPADPAVRVLPKLYAAHLELARARATHSLDAVLSKLRRLVGLRYEADAPALSQVRRVAAATSSALAGPSAPHEARGARRGEPRDPGGTRGGVPLEHEDVRVAHQLLAQAMRIYEQPLAAGLGQTLTVGPDAGSFRLGTGPTVDMRRRRSTRMLLGVLVRRRLEAPGSAVSCDELVELLWPDDRADRATVTSRLYVAILSLRRLGLGEHIVGCPDGYLIDARAPVAMSRA